MPANKKPAIKKAAIKVKPAVKKPIAAKIAKLEAVKAPRASSLSVPVYSLLGRASGIMVLPKEVFGQVVNEKLLAQAVRVYSTNQKTFTAKTKTRGEVQGSTAKIYRQKGTGRARHGSVRAPIFVGGGIVFGPRPRKVVLDLPKKMKKRALIYALSSKLKDKEIVGLIGAEKASGKTKQIAELTRQLKVKSALIITSEKMDNVVRSVRNIPHISVLPAGQVNAYDVLRHQMLVITKDSIGKLTEKGEKK